MDFKEFEILKKFKELEKKFPCEAKPTGGRKVGRQIPTLTT